MSGHIFLKSNWRQIDNELDMLERAPETAAILMNQILDMGYRLTQQAVHIETMSLKLSGKKTSQWKNDKWVGEIRYGGPTFGPKNPVTYAIYEKARGTHWAGPSSIKGDHDFMRPLTVLPPLYNKAIMKAIGG